MGVYGCVWVCMGVYGGVYWVVLGEYGVQGELMMEMYDTEWNVGGNVVNFIIFVYFVFIFNFVQKLNL
jgi:hypothetical protein